MVPGPARVTPGFGECNYVFSGGHMSVCIVVANNTNHGSHVSFSVIIGWTSLKPTLEQPEANLTPNLHLPHIGLLPTVADLQVRCKLLSGSSRSTDSPKCWKASEGSRISWLLAAPSDSKPPYCEGRRARRNHPSLSQSTSPFLEAHG